MARHVKKAGGPLWYAVFDVPKDVRDAPFFHGRRRLTAPIALSDQRKAERKAASIVSAWKDQVEAARRSQPSALETTVRDSLVRMFRKFSPPDTFEFEQTVGCGHRVDRDRMKAE
jgi:hypothetical protein